MGPKVLTRFYRGILREGEILAFRCIGFGQQRLPKKWDYDGPPFTCDDFFKVTCDDNSVTSIMGRVGWGGLLEGSFMATQELRGSTQRQRAPARTMLFQRFFCASAYPILSRNALNTALHEVAILCRQEGLLSSSAVREQSNKVNAGQHGNAHAQSITSIMGVVGWVCYKQIGVTSDVIFGVTSERLTDYDCANDFTPTGIIL